MKICLIGNSGILTNDKGGQTTKLRLYKKKIEDEGLDLYFVDLERFFYHPFSIFKKIKRGIKEYDRIVLISGERACRLLIPYVNRINKKYHKPFVLPVVGSGLLHYSFDHLSEKEQHDFFFNKKYDLTKRNKKIERELSKVDLILPETELLTDIYHCFYSINNCRVLSNFRDIDRNEKDVAHNCNQLKVVYLSRVMIVKGVLDLLNVVQQLGNIYLDIFGSVDLDKNDRCVFNSFLNEYIVYHGSVDNELVVDVLNQYDILVFPTHCPYEGVPGVISESLIAGTPILTSNFPNAKYILRDGYDSIFYEMFNVDDLKTKLKWCINNKDKIRAMRKNCLESARKFTYEYNRKDFLKYVCGVEEE